MVITGTEQSDRFLAKGLGDVMDEQGRKRRWLADRIGVSESYLSMVISGGRTVDRALGERIGSLLGVPFFLLFELAE